MCLEAEVEARHISPAPESSTATRVTGLAAGRPCGMKGLSKALCVAVAVRESGVVVVAGAEPTPPLPPTLARGHAQGDGRGRLEGGRRRPPGRRPRRPTCRPALGGRKLCVRAAESRWLHLRANDRASTQNSGQKNTNAGGDEGDTSTVTGKQKIPIEQS